VSQLELVLDEIIIERPDTVQHLCADRGYTGEPAQKAIKERNYIPHVKTALRGGSGEKGQSVVQMPPMDCRGCSLMVQ
jgi:hypothetical protein